MTSIELPDPLWEMTVAAQYNGGNVFVTTGYGASLLFYGHVVFEKTYDEISEPAIFHDALHGDDIEHIREVFAKEVAFKFDQMFHSWGGPIL